MASAANFQKMLKTLKEENTLDSKIQALTSLRRVHLEDQKKIKSLKDEEFCELCNSIIDASVREDDKLHIEACHTLDIILPETKNRNFDFFQSILQINRKKRLKILVSLSILKDETIVIIANESSILNFLNNCMQSIQPKSMNWLLPENAENATLLKSVENKILNENEEFEEKIIEKVLQLLCRLCNLSSLGLNIQQFDTLIMDKIIILAYMGHHRQRTQALIVLQQAVKNDLGVRMRLIHREIWEKYKVTLQNIYCKRMTMLVNACNQDWAAQWETSITFIGTDLHRGSGLVNSLLKVEELAFKSADPNRRQAFLSWKLLIDNFALDQRELATTRRIKLLCVPLNAKNSKTELMVLTKLEVWWHLIHKVYPSISECIDTVLVPFLNLCFGPFADKPLFVQKTDNSVSLGKKFIKTQIFAIDAFQQLIVCKVDQLKTPCIVKEKLPNPVSSAVFEGIYKIFIHCFGEIVLSLGLLSNEDVKNKVDICQNLWNNLINRIEEYDKMKVLMYKEVMNVVSELIKNRFHKIIVVRDFLFNVLKILDNISCSMHFTESMLEDLVQAYLQVDNFSYFTNDHYQCIESLLWHLIKPQKSNVYYLQTLELMQIILKILDDAKKINSNTFAVCKVWCILASIAKKYIEDSQNIDEGTPIEHNFKTIESIITFPFTSIFTEDHVQLIAMAVTWKDLYKQFDFQVELIVSIKPNEILEKMSNVIITALKKDKRSCNFAVICIDGLLSTVNYDNLPNDKEIPIFVQLLKELIFQCFLNKSFVTEKMLKALSAFLLSVFSHSIEKTGIYLKIIEPIVRYMLAKVDDNNLEHEISTTWSTIVGLFKKLQKSLNYELLSCYRQTIVLAMLHLNMDISSVAFSILDMKDSVDEKSKKVLEDIINELEETSVKNNFDIVEMQEKSKKVKNARIKPVGSFLNRKSMSPSSTVSIVQNGKENIQKIKVINIEPDSQDFVVINTSVKIDVDRLTDHQKEMLKKRRDDIPAMYNELTVSNSQDSQELQHWFDAKTGILPSYPKNETPSNNNEMLKAAPTSQVLSTELQKNFKKSVASATTSSKSQQKKRIEDVNVSTIGNSQCKKQIEGVPIVAKKLDFESREEFPANTEQISPSFIDKMRRKNLIEESNETDVNQDKSVRYTRRSLQPQQVTLRKFNSTEQLNKRGKKRRNSESNSEGMLSIEREKRPRRPDTPDTLQSVKINENKKGVEPNGKKISKRQMNEMSRLKIDMRFEPLPSRRSIIKVNESSGDKKMFFSKDEKLKEEKVETNVQQQLQQQNSKKNQRRSMKGSGTVSAIKVDNNETIDHKKLTTISENTDTTNKLATRKLVTVKTGSVISFLKKNDVFDESQEKINIDDVSSLITCSEQIDHISESKILNIGNDESVVSELKSSQDSDIVESSQEPNLNTKMDKVECFIKIKKVELQQSPVNSDEELEKDEKIIEETSIDLDETSIIPATADPQKLISVEVEVKKTESKASVPAIHASSPKSTNSRIFRSKGFPLQGRAAQMLGLVTKQSLAEKLVSDPSKIETALNDEVTIVPITKRDKSQKESERISSPSTGGSGLRQEKMFSNMSSSMRQEMCSSPSMTMFCNLRNDGERISLKLDKPEYDFDVVEKEKETSQNNSQNANGDESPNSKSKKELPLLEWSNANPPSLTASPSASILKRMPEISIDTPSRKKRVSFADPPVSREMGYEIMTESSSPPKLEKLPSSRSPISRKESKKHTKLRLIQMVDPDKFEKENEIVQLNNSEEKLANPEIIDETVDNSQNTVSTNPKIKLATVLYEISLDESKIVEVENNATNLTPQVDIFVDNNNLPANDENMDGIKTSTQSDQNNSSIKLESINLSNILHKSDNHQSSLEDTVDVENISSSLDTTPNLSDKPAGSSSQQSGEQGDTLPVTDSIFSNLPLTQETQNSVAQLNEPENLDSTLPVYPSLISCVEAVENISAELVDPLFTNHLAKHLSIRSIRSVGDLAQLTERDINRLPIRSPKIPCVKKALSRYQEKLLEKTPEKKTTNVVSSSTPLGNKRRDKSKHDNVSLEDLMKSGANNSDFGSINVSALYECKRPIKRFSMDNSMQTSPVKKTKANDEEACTEMMDQCDEGFLFQAFVKRFDAEKILKGYKEKMIDKSEKELKKDTLNMLGLSIEDDSEDSFKVSTKNVGLQKVLQQLPKIFDADDEFFDTLLKSYKKKLKAAKVLDVLKSSDIKIAIMDKFSSIELLNILIKRLLQEKEKYIHEAIPDTSDIQVLLDRISINSILEQVKTREELKSSETLLKIALENSTVLSEEIKVALFKTLTENLNICELADMYNETIKFRVRKMQEK